MGNKKEYLRKLIKVLGYELCNGTEEIWEKCYINSDNYIIRIDFENEVIIYDTGEKGKSIIVCNKTTSNFSKNENFVVLECVDRLLNKGYKANSIELEHSWASGHKESGRLDVLIKKDNEAYLMIECKTFGEEFKKEKNNMLTTKKVGNEEQPRGQLFTYCFQEKTTEYLCLYASTLNENEIKYENAIVQVEESWRKLSNQKELFDFWNKTFKYNGIFEYNVKPYNIECRALLRKDLQKITDEDSSRIFNQFLEILRHNVVSDKPNAFNKMLNLFICKIIDEDRNDDEEVKFQWKEDSTFVSMQSDLEDLYKQGMDKFLDIEVTDYSDVDIDKRLAILDVDAKNELKKIFQELRLQKNPEFAFKEVYNEESFNENAKVVKEVVQLLQPFQFRYGHKQQFLGNFFELLLNTSIKQESGQFFTPVPIARFMIACLPIKDIIDNKIKNNNKEILPIGIDYSNGSGHFLTEYMDVVQLIINKYDTNNFKKSVKNTIDKWKQSDNKEMVQGEFEWAKDYVYGIEKDYRLVKTAKISTFLNGDGNANIIHADGLDKFTSSKYKGLLSSSRKVNENFDIIIANPPYSVQSFKQTLMCDSEDFELYNLLTENSSEIECLFVERSIQLLKEDGCAAIILPSTILTNTSQITEKTRELLLRNFNVKAIVKMGPNTFMATGTSTVILFLQKRPKLDYNIVEKLVEKFFVTQKDFSYNGTQNVVKKYVEECLCGVLFNDYISLLKNNQTKAILESEYYREIIKLFKNNKEYKDLIKRKTFKKLELEEREKQISKLLKDFMLSIEKKKLIYYVLTFSNKTLLINTGEKQSEKNFIGYEFSNRRGYEGIHYYTDENGCINSSLYDEEELNTNVSKVSYYINQSFKNNYPVIIESLKNNMILLNNIDILNFEIPIFNCSISTKSQKKLIINTDYPIMKLGDNNLIELLDDKRTPVSKKNRSKGIYPYYGATGIIDMVSEYIFDEKIVLIGEDGAKWDANQNTAFIVNEKCWVNNHAHVIKTDESKLLPEYLVIVLNTYDLSYYITDTSPKKLTQGNLLSIKIPVPPIKIQKKIIKEYEDIKSTLKEKENIIIDKKKDMQSYIGNIYAKGYDNPSLDEVAVFKRGPFGGALKKENFVSSGYKVYEQKHAINNNFEIGRYYINEEKFQEMKGFELEPKDIIMSCSGTIGKIAIFPDLAEKGIINQALLRFRPKRNILPLYLKMQLENITNTFKEKSHGVALKNIASVDVLKSIKIPVPEIDEQIKIMSQIEVLENEINEITKQKNDENIKLKELLDRYI